MTEIDRFDVSPQDPSMVITRYSPWTSDKNWGWVARYYAEAISALKAHETVIDTVEDRYQGRDDDDRVRQINFARSLLAPRDGESRKVRGRVAREHLERRVDRYEYRLHQAISRIGAKRGVNEKKVREGLGISLHERTKDGIDFLRMIMDGRPSGERTLPVFVLHVQAEAHLSMHAVEAWRAMSLGEKAAVVGTDEKTWLEEELDRSVTLDTFAFCISRTAPWLFARDEAQREAVIRDVATSWENVVPLRCMWIASQISLLALHRRAYARGLKEDRASAAYNDYHKLQFLIRDTERRIEGAPVQVAGARGFLAGLNAEAHHHIGELYRAEHAHKPALEHFEAASHRLELLRKEDNAFDEVLINSRWYVELKISRGKACYEMGRHKEALCWHMKAWRAFLELLSGETLTDTNTKDVTAAINWLESVKFEPELRKSEISEWVGPVVDQLDRISPVGRVGALAAEILLRLGHLLFVLNIGDGKGFSRERLRGTLAYTCLAKAAECDPYSTLIGANLLKIKFRLDRQEETSNGPLEGLKEQFEQPPLRPIEQHWPRGGSDFERLARGAEYLMLKAREGRFGVESGEDSDQAEIDGLLARDLLLDLFMSTDSINVRKSQIHRFLMEPRAKSHLPGREDNESGVTLEPAIEFICMRRYSSPFPLLPRPSAFRALGGGYFLRLHDPHSVAMMEDKPYGIAVDPGVDFVENLYRTGYSLGDVDMIIITHDHVDHLGALDPLLSLLHVRSQVLIKQDHKGQLPAKRIVVLTSESVKQRYKKVGKLSGAKSRNFLFRCFENTKRTGTDRSLDLEADLGFPSGFEIITMSSASGAGAEDRSAKRDGHRDLSDRPSHGICVRWKKNQQVSVAICSDTPPPPPQAAQARLEKWKRVWGPALRSAIMVVHLGSVPLTELRRMDDHGNGSSLTVSPNSLGEQELKLRELQEALEDATRPLQGQIEYAQWLRSHSPREDAEEILAPIVGSVPVDWLPPPEHNFLVGILRWAREYRDRWSELCQQSALSTRGLFVVGELSEELGTMRGKVAIRLNHRIFEVNKKPEAQYDDTARVASHPYALTADIGLQACVRSEESSAHVEVLCTTCNLDNDRTAAESYHACQDVYEVCVKGENEGIFYNCREHDPARQDEPAFLEQLERFDIFGR